MQSGAITPAAGGQAAVLQPATTAREFPFVQIAWFSALLIAVFFPVLYSMVKEWIELEEMGHAFFVPVVAGYVVWTDRERILAQPVKPCLPALLLTLYSFFQMVLGFLGADFFVARTAFLLGIISVIWTVAGFKVLKSLAFPLFLLLFMIRIPLFLYQQLTFPLQLLASKLAAGSLEILGLPVLRDGNVLELPNQKLQVIEACSGIRSLLSLSFLSLAYSYVFDKRVWMRPVLFLLTIPITIVANALRITLTGVISEYNKEWADGFFHTFEGWLLFMVALGSMVACHSIISRFMRPSNA